MSEKSTSILERSQFAAHLARYPTVTAVAHLVANLPGVQTVVSNATPILHAVHERSRPVSDPLARRAKPLLVQVDALSDQALTRLDSRLPALRTTHPSDVYEGAQSRIETTRETFGHVYDERIVKPISSVARSARDQYTKVYDSQFNDRIAPLNDRIETVIDTYLPGSKTDVSTTKSGSQLDRTVKLARLAAERAAPQLELVRSSTREHIREVYSKLLDGLVGEAPKASVFNRATATVGTAKALGKEAYEKVTAFFKRTVKPGAAARASEIREKVETAAGDLKLNIETTVHDLHGKVASARDSTSVAASNVVEGNVSVEPVASVY